MYYLVRFVVTLRNEIQNYNNGNLWFVQRYQMCVLPVPNCTIPLIFWTHLKIRFLTFSLTAAGIGAISGTYSITITVINEFRCEQKLLGVYIQTKYPCINKSTSKTASSSQCRNDFWHVLTIPWAFSLAGAPIVDLTNGSCRPSSSTQFLRTDVEDSVLNHRWQLPSLQHPC